MSEPDPRPSGLSQTFKRLIDRLFGRTDEKEELIEQLREAQAHSVIDADAVSMMEGVLQVADLAVRDLMIPRGQMDVLDINEPLDTLLPQVIEAAHSRFPVTDGSKDNIIGILLAKDLLRVLANDEKDIRGLLRPAVFVPESKRLNVLLRDFRNNRNHIAIVVDEYGEVEGLVTLQDIVEELVGEFSTQGPRVRRALHWDEDGTTVVDGMSSLRELNRGLGLSLPLDSAKTLNGLILETLQDIPEANVSLKVGNVPLEILQVQGRVIRRVKILRPLVDPSKEPSEGDGMETQTVAEKSEQV